jgi:hypothetical protein
MPRLRLEMLRSAVDDPDLSIPLRRLEGVVVGCVPSTLSPPDARAGWFLPTDDEP